MRVARMLSVLSLGPLLLPLVMGAPPLACSAPCSAIHRYYAGGTRHASDALILYETSPDSGPFIAFAGGATLHIRHGMGVRPQDVRLFLSFNEYPQGDGTGGYAPSAGNQAIVLSSDAEETVVKNDTCASYWIRVVLIAVPDRAGSDAGGPG